VTKDALDQERKNDAVRQAFVQDLFVRAGWRDDGAREFVKMMEALKADPNPIAQDVYRKLGQFTPAEWKYAIDKLPERKPGRPRGADPDDHVLALRMIEPVILAGRPVTRVAAEFAPSAKGNSNDSAALRLERTFRRLTGWKRKQKRK
jgi:hypothetical protein